MNLAQLPGVPDSVVAPSQQASERSRTSEARHSDVFAARSGAPYTDSGFKANWSKIMADFVKSGGERFATHDLRAMYDTEMVSRDKKPETHKNAATTRRVYDRRRKVTVTPTF